MTDELFTMKTLDEVIEAFEKACDLERRCEDCSGCLGQEEGCPNDGANAVPDALYHLKNYRSDMQMYAENQKYWEDELKQKIKDFGDAKERYIARLKELEIGKLNDPLIWDELFCLEMIGRPVWSEEKRGWMLLIDSALDNRSWVDLVDSSGKIIRIGPHDLEKYQLYKREKK